MKYNFDEKEHVHTLDGRPLMGVTSVLRIIAKPFLVQWAANMACDYIRHNGDIIPEGYVVTEDVLKKASLAHRKTKEKAGDWGTEVHKAVENWIKMNIEPVLPDDQMLAFNNFKTWAKDNEIIFLQSEKHVYSENLWIGGVLDLVIGMGGKKYIADIKTSSGIFNEAFFQMGGYNLCLEEMGENGDIDGYLVINLKKDGTIDFKMATDMDFNKRAFLAALDLYKLTNQVIQ